MAFELVIFDCDGVLVDSEPLSNRILSSAFQAAGFPIDYETCVSRMVGLSLPACFRLAEELCGRPLPDGFESALRERTYAAFRRELRPVPGVRAAVEAVPLPRCVASSGEPDKIRLSLGVTGLWPLFEGRVFSARQPEVKRGKPAPDLFLFAAERMGAAPGACAVVEDSLPGVRAGLAAGMAVFGYAGGAHPPGLAPDLGAAGATVFDDMAALPGLLGFG